MFLEETVLQRVEFAVLLETFDGCDGTAVGLNCEDCARLNCSSIHHHRARATVTGVTTNVRTGESQAFTEEVDQQQAWFDVCTTFLTIDGYFDWYFRHR